MLPARAPQPTVLNVRALLASILLVAPFLRALRQAMQAADTTWLPANGDLLLSGAVIAAVLIGDSLRSGRPTRAFLLALAGCLAAIGLACAVFAISLQFDIRQARAGQPHGHRSAAGVRLRLWRPPLPEAGLPRRRGPLARPAAIAAGGGKARRSRPRPPRARTR